MTLRYLFPEIKRNAKSRRFSLLFAFSVFIVASHIHVKDTLVYVTIGTTEEHPFWVEDNGWVKIKNLNNGNIVRDKNGNNLVIEDVQIVKLPKNQYVVVYNFQVADYHTYFIANCDILVHNDCKSINFKGVKYPKITDLKIRGTIHLPTGDVINVPKEKKVPWYRNKSEADKYRTNDTDILCKADFISEHKKYFNL